MDRTYNGSHLEIYGYYQTINLLILIIIPLDSISKLNIIWILCMLVRKALATTRAETDHRRSGPKSSGPQVWGPVGGPGGPPEGSRCSCAGADIIL